MNKTRKSFSLTMILTIMLLGCLLIYSFGSTGAWFSSTGSKLQFTLNVSGADIYVYQTINGNDIKLNAAEQTYITLEQEIVPGEEVPLVLKVKNNEPAGSYLRFKFQVYALGQTNTFIPISSNYQKVIASADGFTEYYESGGSWFCYEQDSSKVGADESKQVKVNGETLLISGFTIPEDYFDINNLNGHTIKVVMTVECSDLNWYAN